jgi:hypothetical protein
MSRGNTYCAIVVDTPMANSPDTLPSSDASFLFGLGNESGRFFCVAEQKRALRSERNTLGRSFEQAHTEIIFEGFDLKCHGWLRQEQVFSRFSKAQMLSHRAKDLQAKVFELRHRTIIHAHSQKSAPVPGPCPEPGN